jgi:hypothetical protein
MRMTTKTFAKFRQTKLETFTGTVTIISPVSIEKYGTVEPSTYIIEFVNGQAFKMHRDKRICFGEMQLGMLMLFRCGSGNECRRHLLFPESLLLENRVIAQLSAGVPSAEIDFGRSPSFDRHYAGMGPCRFHSFRNAMLSVGLDKIRYEVKAA